CFVDNAGGLVPTDLDIGASQYIDPLDRRGNAALVGVGVVVDAVPIDLGPVHIAERDRSELSGTAPDEAVPPNRHVGDATAGHTVHDESSGAPPGFRETIVLKVIVDDPNAFALRADRAGDDAGVRVISEPTVSNRELSRGFCEEAGTPTPAHS